MVLVRSVGALLTLIVALASGALPHAQQASELPQPLTQMLETERAFAARALVVGWKAAFLEYFADNAVGFDQGRAGLARDQIVANPDPPKDHRLIREPRHGDIAASGDLGYLTGPVQSILPSRDNGRPRHSTYTSIWKRERNGAFKVVMEVGTNTPSPVPFAAGFTRAASADRFTGDYDDTTPPLAAADGILNSALRAGQAAAYRGRLAAGARFHRQNVLPVVGERTVTRWLATQPAYTVADSRYAEAARSGDLGYTWGAYAIGPRQKPTQQGFYVRIWERERKGQWKIAMDILQPQ